MDYLSGIGWCVCKKFESGVMELVFGYFVGVVFEDRDEWGDFSCLYMNSCRGRVVGGFFIFIDNEV